MEKCMLQEALVHQVATKDLQTHLSSPICQPIARHAHRLATSLQTTGCSFCMVKENILTFLRRHYITLCYQVFPYQPTGSFTPILLNRMDNINVRPGSGAPAARRMSQGSFPQY